MNEDHPLDELPAGFWDWIALAKEDSQQFAAQLQSASREKLLKFIWTFEEVAAEFKYEPYVNYVSDALSEDGIDDLAQWIVERGRAYVYDVFDDPAGMPQRVDHPDGYLSKAVRAYYKRFGGPVPLRPE